MSFKKNTIHTLCGTSKSGKSYLLRHMLSTMLRSGELKFGLVFTATKFTGAYNWLPDKYVYANFDMEVLAGWLAWLAKEKKKADASGKELPHSFIVFDDIVDSLPLKTPAWKHFITKFRHWNITVFFTLQYPNLIDPVTRSQTEYAWIFAQHNDKQFRSTYDWVGGLLASVGAWRTYLNAHTGDYQCIMWSRESKPVMAERYKTYKAPGKWDPVKFKF